MLIVPLLEKLDTDLRTKNCIFLWCPLPESAKFVSLVEMSLWWDCHTWFKEIFCFRRCKEDAKQTEYTDSSSSTARTSRSCTFDFFL